MDRKDAREQLEVLNYKSILIEHPTGYGKSKSAIDYVKKNSKNNQDEKLLIVVSKRVHKEVWNKELEKWWNDRKIKVEYVTYMYLSIMSISEYNHYDYIICDECHHFTNKSYFNLHKAFSFDYIILLSATVKKDWAAIFAATLPNYIKHKITLREAINANVLPDPEIHLYPLELDNVDKCDEYTVKKGGVKTVVKCTQKAMIDRLDDKIMYFKMLYLCRKNEIYKNKWLNLCSKRLAKLSEYKEKFILKIIREHKDEKTITFCNNIAQTERLGHFCINCKNKLSYLYLEQFNNDKIKHITTCDMLNEGVNLNNCKIGIFANLTNSDIIIKQRNGRLLRHKEPVFIIPYYKGTRDEELMNKMIQDYNKEKIFIKTIK